MTSMNLTYDAKKLVELGLTLKEYIRAEIDLVTSKDSPLTCEDVEAMKKAIVLGSFDLKDLQPVGEWTPYIVFRQSLTAPRAISFELYWHWSV